MSQFTPTEHCCYPNLQNPVSTDEYTKAVDYMYLVGLENGYVQDFTSADKNFTPPFDLSGV